MSRAFLITHRSRQRIASYRAIATAAPLDPLVWPFRRLELVLFVMARHAHGALAVAALVDRSNTVRLMWL